MTVRLVPSGSIELAGACGVDDAETLLAELLASPDSPVQWQSCEYLHSAVIRVLLIAKPRVEGVPSSAFLRDHIGPLLRAPAP